MLKIGDKVSFLNEVGGGVVSGFQGNGIVLVEDEDGFEIPMRISEVCVVANESYDKPNPYAPKPTTAVKSLEKVAEEPLKSTAPTVVESYSAPISDYEERAGGDKLYAYLAFVPMNGKDMGNNRYAVFYVNDSNYFQQFVLSTRENSVCHFRKAALVEPNTKMLIDEVGKEDLNDIERVLVQMIAYKDRKPYMRRPIVDTELRIDGRKFYKITSFTENDFFEEDALLIPIVEDDNVSAPEEELPKKISISSNCDASKDNKTNFRKSSLEGKVGEGQSPLVIDLHASEILETTAGMQPIDILHYQTDYFNKIMKQNLKNVGQKIVFIHGKGEGVLRAAIINELTYRYKRCKYQDASFQEYGFGATMVTIRA
ncbi:MAG: DUF2027 domain-containing protein [Prevotella sp.]|nr:DUF2027 domain-containing protein [Prevotella sp.]